MITGPRTVGAKTSMDMAFRRHEKTDESNLEWFSSPIAVAYARQPHA